MRFILATDEGLKFEELCSNIYVQGLKKNLGLF